MGLCMGMSFVSVAEIIYYCGRVSFFFAVLVLWFTPSIRPHSTITCRPNGSSINHTCFLKSLWFFVCLKLLWWHRLLAAFVVLVEGNQRTRWRFWQPHSQQRWGFLLFTWTWPYFFTWTWQYFFAWTWQYFLPGPDNTFYLADRIIKCCIQFWVENPCYTRNILL